MKKVGAVLVLCLMPMLGACTTGNGVDWETAAPIIENISAIGAGIAFAQPDVAEHKKEICTAVAAVTDVLENYDDPNATFESIRQVALDAVRNLPPEVLSDELKPLVITIVDTVLNTAWLYVKDNYQELIEQDQAKTVILVATSVARGINTACGPAPQMAPIIILDE